MSGRYLLDTSVAIELLRNAQSITDRLSGGMQVCISTTVLGELLFGAERSRRPEESRSQVIAFAADCVMLKCDEMTAARYAQIKAALAAKGKPIPENDLWIAASAMQHNLTLAGRDEHFTLIDGLNFERW